jgi:hypothetical protein
MWQPTRVSGIKEAAAFVIRTRCCFINIILGYLSGLCGCRALYFSYAYTFRKLLTTFKLIRPGEGRE